MHLHVVRLFEPSHNHHVPAPGGPSRRGSSPGRKPLPLRLRRPPRWVGLAGGQLVLLHPGRLLSVYEAERGIPGDSSVAFVCPGADPLGLRRLRAADVDCVEYVDDIDDSDIKNNAAVALPLAPASDRGHQGALPGGGAGRWPSLPPATAATPAALAKPVAASRRQRHAAAAVHHKAARVAAALAVSAANFSGSHQGTFGAPRAGGDESLSTPAPQVLPGTESWADLMDADNATAEKVAGRGSVDPPNPRLGAVDIWSSQRAADGADVMRTQGACPRGARGPTCPPTQRLSTRP